MPNRLYPALLAISLTLAPIGAAADPQGTKPGVQKSAPGPAAPNQPQLSHDLGQRRAIRGCAVDTTCHRTMSRGLVEFEREAFPRTAADSPWIDSDRKRPVHRRVGGMAPGRVVAETKVPDLPWLRGIVLPDLPVRWDGRVLRYLAFYRTDPRGRRLMRSWLERQARYRDLIAAELRRAKLPADLIYIAMIESSYAPKTRSRSGAAGLWQFMPAGGRIYGLRRSRWIDERSDPVLSTRAVTSYFADLYHRFGDWHLAMAAYNAGYGAVLNAVVKYNTNDFWALLDHENALPWESSLYVPKALAVAIIGRNAAKFGFGDIKPRPRFAFDNVTVPTSVSLSTVARAAGASLDAIKKLNPQLLRGRTPPGVKRYVVRIPAGTSARFGARFAQLRGDWDKYDAYVVKHGQRFEDIATEFGIGRAALRRLNGVGSESEVRGGTLLVVPRTSAAKRAQNRKAAADNLYAAGVPRGVAGDKLLVPVSKLTPSVRGKKRVFYRVVSGDSQSSVAAAFGVPMSKVAKWNGLSAKAHLHPRMVLELWVPRSFAADRRGIDLLDAGRLVLVERGSKMHIDLAEKRVGRVRLTYTAKKRENFNDIGRKYGLTARDLSRINRLPHTTVLSKGDKILVYKVVDASKSKRAKEQARRARKPSLLPKRGRARIKKRRR